LESWNVGWWILAPERFDALAELAREGFQVRRGNITKSATKELLLEGVEFSGQVGKLLAGGGGDLLFYTLLIRNGARVNFALELPMPPNEGGFGDTELATDAGKAHPLNAEAQEFVTDGGRVHGRFGMVGWWNDVIIFFLGHHCFLLLREYFKFRKLRDWNLLTGRGLR